MNSTMLFAFMAAAGVFMVVMAVGPRTVRVRLVEEDQRPFLDRLMDSWFAPAAKRVMTATGRSMGEFESDKSGMRTHVPDGKRT